MGKDSNKKALTLLLLFSLLIVAAASATIYLTIQQQITQKIKEAGAIQYLHFINLTDTYWNQSGTNTFYGALNVTTKKPNLNLTLSYEGNLSDYESLVLDLVNGTTFLSFNLTQSSSIVSSTLAFNGNATTTSFDYVFSWKVKPDPNPEQIGDEPTTTISLFVSLVA